jgi:2-polyprenyl-3-methyl-5-hydroxy-6-metoxy-1,4-benzoquinol methylase
MQSTTDTLREHRIRAAEASGGFSADVIYRSILRVVDAQKLTGNVLDFGAGVGNLTRQLHALGCFRSVTASDILPRPADLLDEIEWHHLDLNQPAALSAGSFDTLIAAEVIEHLENPRELAREWHRLLKPGGTLLLSTPNNESIRSLVALLIRGHYVAFDDSCYPAHITALLRKDISRLLSESGFTDIRFYFTDHGGLPKMPLVTWQQISGGLLNGVRFSDNLIATAVR